MVPVPSVSVLGNFGSFLGSRVFLPSPIGGWRPELVSATTWTGSARLVHEEEEEEKGNTAEGRIRPPTTAADKDAHSTRNEDGRLRC